MIKQYAGYSAHTSNEGDWSGNIYDFFCKVRTRMDDDVAVPFANDNDFKSGNHTNYKKRNFMREEIAILETRIF